MVLLTVMCVRKQTCSVTYSRFQCECEPMAHFDDIIFELVIQRYIAAVIAFQCWIEDGGHFRIITHLFISIFVCIIWWRKTHHFLLIQCMHGSGIYESMIDTCMGFYTSDIDSQLFSCRNSLFNFKVCNNCFEQTLTQARSRDTRASGFVISHRNLYFLRKIYFASLQQCSVVCEHLNLLLMLLICVRHSRFVCVRCILYINVMCSRVHVLIVNKYLNRAPEFLWPYLLSQTHPRVVFSCHRMCS